MDLGVLLYAPQSVPLGLRAFWKEFLYTLGCYVVIRFTQAV